MIKFTINQEIAVIELFPDDKFNILNIPTIIKLRETFKEISVSQAKVIRVKGHGGSFAVGADIREMIKYSGFTAKKFSILGNSLFRLMDSIPQVIIGEIDGFCMGGGVDFAASCDFRLATKKSKFAHPGAKLGIITGFGGTQRLPRLMKPAYLQKLFLFGDMVDAEFMKEANFILETFESVDEMNNFADNFAKKIASKNKLFLGEYKSVIGK
ncbi:enoyl-CoA hydratase/isomerase family protein [Deferribacteraceae bacterium V6Fe1]|nr:enoyl-CoA hydratase/isomerase family protein [Deferribacteraceae bacterium V6Fe1]